MNNKIFMFFFIHNLMFLHLFIILKNKMKNVNKNYNINNMMVNL